MRVIATLLSMCCELGCAAETPAGGSRRVPPGDAQADGCASGEVRSCACDDGSAGEQSCLSGWQPCSCDSMAPTNYGNAAGQAGGGAPVVPDPQPAAPMRLEHCDPGLYLGTYDCELDFLGIVAPLMGDVSFNLEINEEVLENQCDSSGEFCADLVIADGSGTLYGIAAGLWGFEAPLRGGLDCTTGAFRTEPLVGVWGGAVSSDPFDPAALWTVAQPPAGMFDGELAGMHSGTEPQVIAGDWNLVETASQSTCVGPFNVELQP